MQLRKPALDEAPPKPPETPDGVLVAIVPHPRLLRVLDHVADVGGARWRPVRRALDVSARHPESPTAHADLAKCWARLAVEQPPPTGKPRLGYSIRPDRKLQHAGLTARALTALTAAIEGGSAGDPELFRLRGDLRFGWCQFDEAFANMAAATAATRGLAAGPRRGLIAAREATMRKRIPGPPAREQLEQLDRLTDKFCGVGARLISKPSPTNVYGPGELDVALDPRMIAFDHEAGDLPLEHLGWMETPALSERLGRRSIESVWVERAGGTFVVSCCTTAKSRLIEVDTELSDGRRMATIATASRHDMIQAAGRDRLAVDEDFSVAALLDLHLARVAVEFALAPGLEAMPVRTRDDYFALNARDLLGRRAARIAEGMSDTEAHGYPFLFPEVFVPMIKAKAHAAVLAAVAAETD